MFLFSSLSRWDRHAPKTPCLPHPARITGISSWGGQTSACQAVPGFGSRISDPELRMGEGEAFVRPGIPAVRKGKERKDRVPQQVTRADGSLQSNLQVTEAWCASASTPQQRSLPRLKDSPCSALTPSLSPFLRDPLSPHLHYHPIQAVSSFHQLYQCLSKGKG